jgi:hypothetical protein
MDWNEPFPLNAVPPRVRNTILNEFKGRCPSIREVAEIPDSDWLATPNIGPAFLEQIRSVTDAPPEQTASPSCSRLTDGELLGRLEWLQDELRWLQEQHAGTTLAADQLGACVSGGTGHPLKMGGWWGL